ncbi:hypothetical protein K458DRAFT_389331 [Lentithecium fluviatile CBS 122367]|uniref:Jacalin-type lectin domain-containing protein n=1 Tax=Lentithecium fluviatile CBS 122367 TaxID=1168545 RepID=A0A6G1J0S7_9PLEO|nr:hypothetical protein K458DRAFT_389331 [Lentithecium fluviatile CBS 122367]
MYISFFATAALILTGVARAVDTNRKSCDNGPWVAPTFAGEDWKAPDYQRFCEAGLSDGDVLTGIKIWKADWQIHAVSLRWGSHDYGKVYGNAKDANTPDAKAEWDASTKVFIRMWNNKPDDGDPIDAVGKISVEVEGKDAVVVSAKKVGAEIKYSGGAGMILAAAGAQGEWVSTLQFHYLESKIVDAAMTSITFTDSLDKYNSERKGMTPAIIGNLFITNSNPIGGANQTYSLSPKIEKQTSKSVTTSMSHAVGTTIGVKVSYEASVPELMSAKTEFSAEARYDFTTMKSDTNSETDVFAFQWTIGSTGKPFIIYLCTSPIRAHANPFHPSAQGIPPQSAMHCTATATMGTFDSDYTAKITARLDNGKTFDYNDAGSYKSIAYADAASDCRAIALSEVPQGEGEEANGEKVAKKAKRSVLFRGQAWN